MLERDLGCRVVIETEAFFSRLDGERRVHWSRCCGEATSCVVDKVPSDSFVLLLGDTTEQNKISHKYALTLKYFIKGCRLNKSFYCKTEYVKTDCETET